MVLGALGLGFVAVYGCVGDDHVPASPTPEAGASSSGSSSSSSSSGSSGPCEDPTYCDDKCGSALKDACGVTRDCSTPCGDGRKCDGLRCVCASSPTWCAGRCGDTTDNCGKPINCGGCEAGACDTGTHTCGGCIPEDKATTCAGKACGFAKNNCGQDVDCGGCAGGAACNANVCCEAQSVTCNGKCGSVKNNCVQTVTCGLCCSNGKPVGDPSNCGACGHNCTGYNCDRGICSCSNHGNNTDPNSCGPCGLGPGLDCIKRGFTSCVSGTCR